MSHNKLDKAQSKFLKYNNFFGNEFVASTRRLALINLFLHNIGDIDSDNLISPADALIAQSADKYEYIRFNSILCNSSTKKFQKFISVMLYRSRVLSAKPKGIYKLWITPHRTIEETLLLVAVVLFLHEIH